jgi:feruloyl-CoA synthase
MPEATKIILHPNHQPAFASLDLAPALVDVEQTPDGGYLLRSPMPLEAYEKSLGAMFRRWVHEVPDRVFLGERNHNSRWRTLTYGEAGRLVDSIAQAMLNRDLGPERPVMILSGNSINHALLMLGGFIAGVPVAPVSVAYSLMSQDHGKLKAIFEDVKPALIFVEDGGMFSRALHALDLSGVDVATCTGQIEGVPTIEFNQLIETPPTEQVERAFAGVKGESVAKILFSSGSTGFPKGVINTHDMLCSNQQMLAQVWPFTEKTPPVLLDWLPWNHTFGANHNFNMILKRGGTLYIDGGKPTPALIEETVKNLREISPTIYVNVPAGYGMLLPFLEKDEELRQKFFKNLQLIFYAGAALSQDLWQRLEKLSIQTTGKKVVMTSSWGSTETSPLATVGYFPLEKAGIIGLPCVGVTLKMTPNGGKFELRVKGPNVMPGYLNRPELTAAAFDEDGFYKIGDAGAFADPNDPAKGIVFNGRVAEDFKLSSGTWVHVGSVRLGTIEAASPLIQDALVAGHDREYIGILAWPNLQACRDLRPGGNDQTEVEFLLRSREVVEHLRQRLTAYNAAQQGSSAKIGRIMLMAEPPSIDANEITDKGYINQRAGLERRKELVDKLYADIPGSDVIVL